MTEPVILDSVTHMTDAQRGRVAYCASHGGHYAAYFGASKGIAGLILNDAGIGRERVGLAGGHYLEKLGVASATVSSRSARIGDGRDGHRKGLISFANGLAAKIGVAPGMSCSEALDRMIKAGLPPAPTPPAEDEHRHEIAAAGGGGIKVIAMDSISLVEPGDKDNIAVSGSHGGLLGGRPEMVIRHPVAAAVFNDAGFGKEDAGITRLPVLDQRRIPAACVSSFSARIGDGMSSYNDGYVSAVNELARQHGALIGQSCREFVALMVAARSRS